MRTILQTLLMLTFLISPIASAIKHPTCAISMLDIDIFLKKMEPLHKKLLRAQIGYSSQAEGFLTKVYDNATSVRVSHLISKALQSKGYTTKLSSYDETMDVINLFAKKLENELTAAADKVTEVHGNLESAGPAGVLSLSFEFLPSYLRKHKLFHSGTKISFQLKLHITQAQGDKVAPFTYFESLGKAQGCDTQSAIEKAVKDIPECEIEIVK